ncbi:MAG TPA: 1-(5-phosphoribosyl)-5-[(5-phosphoribosylamino)methylideneamino]imidazole-4-carboxamide isomerase [bacterium]|nr:1-(5-phosphoribosyl)-5-[(5-phosphoribosylamino)methylideneamino]imidazole-4-carboxamide isomerase [bacterium]
MLVIPAIDLKAGKVVRLEQGLMEKDTAYSDDPAAMAKKWAEMGAELIHVVDLDGAFAGRPVNDAAVLEIARAAGVPIELGGGIRDLATIAHYLERGVGRVILGTVAHKDPKLVREACRKFPGKIVVGIDAKGGLVSVRGWAEVTDLPAADLARRYEDMGIAAIIYTDIARDGMLTGPAVEATARLARSVKVPVIASGGVADLGHVRELMKHERDGIVGVITGKAIYEGKLDLREAIRVAKGSGG